jgi:DNA invertase Pin-like site-specific DNA recombinase
MTRRIAIYARCSTADDQTTENQISELRAAAERHGWVVVAVFDDQGVSGSLDRERRPARANAPSCSSSGSARAPWAVCGPLWPL